MTAVALMACRIVLAVVFAVAGVSKLSAPIATREGLTDFGVPSRLVGLLAILLPATEILVAIGLLAPSTMVWGAVGAVGLLAAFSAGIALNLLAHNRPECHCFGNVHSAPIGPTSLFRNALLAALGGWVIWKGSDFRSKGQSLSLEAAELAGLLLGMTVLALASLLGWFVVYSFRHGGRLPISLRFLEPIVGPTDLLDRTPRPLPAGSPAPNFALADLEGDLVDLEDLRARGRPVVLLFVDPLCPRCDAILRRISAGRGHYQDSATIAVITRRGVEENRAKATWVGLEPRQFLLQHHDEVLDAYRVRRTPGAVVVAPDGRIAGDPALGPDAIWRLLARTARKPAPVRLGSRLAGG